MIGSNRDDALHGAEQLTPRMGMPVRSPHFALLAARYQYYRLRNGAQPERIDKKIAHGLKAVLNGSDTLAAQKRVS